MSLNRNGVRFASRKEKFYLLTIFSALFVVVSSFWFISLWKLSQPVIFQIELKFFFGFSVSLCSVLFNETVFFFVHSFVAANIKQSIRVGEDIHKCKHVIPFKFDAFVFLKHQPIPQKKWTEIQKLTKCKERNTNRNQSRRQKGIDGNKIDCWRGFSWKEWSSRSYEKK